MKGIRLLAVAALAAAAGLLSLQLAGAHSRPLRFDPPPGAVLQAAPAAVQGWFSSDIRRDPNWSFLQVRDAQGNRVDTGETVLSGDRRHMRVDLRPGLPPGRYLVTWRTFDDSDGEIFGDCYYFFVGQAAADEALRANLRLDGGAACERIEYNASRGTPVPGQTPAPPASGGGDHEEDTAGNGGIAPWVLVLGVAGGLAVGLVAGRLIAGRGP